MAFEGEVLTVSEMIEVGSAFLVGGGGGGGGCINGRGIYYDGSHSMVGKVTSVVNGLFVKLLCQN
jgi:hypothetical protein